MNQDVTIYRSRLIHDMRIKKIILHPLKKDNFSEKKENNRNAKGNRLL